MNRSALADPVPPVLSIPRPRSRSAFVVGLILLAVGAAAMAPLAAPAWRWLNRPARIAGEPTRLPWSMPSETPWTTVNAYPNLKFFEPTCVAFATDGSQRCFVLERRGTIQMFDNDPTIASSITVCDFSASVWRTPYEDDGAYGLVLHPEFGNESSPHHGEMFVMYTARVGEQRRLRLSRYQLQGDHVGEEFILVDQLNEDLWHNGGGLAFGPDGFLYVGMGDEGTENDHLRNGQCLSRDLYCGILRLDVDCRGDEISHPIVRQPESGKTQGYFIPNDNPFVGQPGMLEEFWAHGLRNPFRIAFDPVDGRLWAADVGNLRREEVNVIVRGGNYGWSYREGTLPYEDSYLGGKKPAAAPGEEIDPVWEYPHLNGNTCVIGGFVYRGGKHSELEGKFIYADNGSGRVWALTAPEQGTVTNEELVALPVSSKTGIASVQPDVNGEPLLVVLGESGATDGTIHRLIPAQRGTASTFPERLSETGVFVDVTTLTPGPSFFPYEINSPQALGAARARHWLSVPSNELDPDTTVDRITWKHTGPWTFPDGTTFVQHFELPIYRNGELRWQRIETRILVRVQGGGVYGVSYRWDESETDAHLVNQPELVEFQVATSQQVNHTQPQTWQFFDRQTCLSCHNSNAGFVLGVTTAQLFDPDESRDALTRLQRQGYFHAPMTNHELVTVEPLVDPSDEDYSISLRARSYLATQCSACHRDGGARANFYAEWNRTANLHELAVAPLQANFGIQDARVVTPGDPYRSVLYYRMAKLGQGRMPFLGAHDLDRDSLRLLHQWISELDGAHLRGVPPITDVSLKRSKLKSLVASPDWTQDTAVAFEVWQELIEDRVPASDRDLLVKQALQQGTPAVRDLFEWFLSSSERSQRLGVDFEPSVVLSLRGDATRGAALFANTQSSSCSNCHQVDANLSSIGPNLAGIGARYDRTMMLQEIMKPSAKVDPKYQTITVSLLDGGVVQGLRQSETEQELTLIDAAGKAITIVRDDIDAIETSSLSLMPENLLQGMTAQQAADLLEYLGSLKDELPAPPTVAY